MIERNQEHETHIVPYEGPTEDQLMVTSSHPTLVEIISALSYALDLTEGQPMGHSVRTFDLHHRAKLCESPNRLGMSASKRTEPTSITGFLLKRMRAAAAMRRGSFIF